MSLRETLSFATCSSTLATTHSLTLTVNLLFRFFVAGMLATSCMPFCHTVCHPPNEMIYQRPKDAEADSDKRLDLLTRSREELGQVIKFVAVFRLTFGARNNSSHHPELPSSSTPPPSLLPTRFSSPALLLLAGSVVPGLLGAVLGEAGTTPGAVGAGFARGWVTGLLTGLAPGLLGTFI